MQSYVYFMQIPTLVFLKGKSFVKDTNSFDLSGFAKGIIAVDGPQGQTAENGGGKRLWRRC